MGIRPHLVIGSEIAEKDSSPINTIGLASGGSASRDFFSKSQLPFVLIIQERDMGLVDYSHND
jgi:hypothetical protein